MTTPKQNQNNNQEYRDRLTRLEALRAAGHSGFEGKYDRSHTLDQLSDSGDGQTVSIAGRVMSLRRMGKIGFATLQDHTGTYQVVARLEDTPPEALDLFNDLLDNADIIGVEGETFTTVKGQPSVMIKKLTILTKTLRPLPEKWAGLQDKEERYRKRYLDMTSDRDVFERFKFRSQFVKLLRQFYWDNGFVEIETPILQNTASGALAKPFVTHHNALDTDVYLRIAPETHLKRAVIGGFDRVFEIGRMFRNEGTDPSHVQDFTMAEHYVAYWDYRDNMSFTEEMFSYLLRNLFGTTTIPITNRNGETTDVDFAGPWPQKTLRELILDYCAIDIDQHQTKESLLDELSVKKIEIENSQRLARGNLIDEIWKKVARPQITGPLFYTAAPRDLAPLARPNDDKPDQADFFQLVVNGWEIIKAYSELADPLEQASSFAQQSAARKEGDEEAMMADDDFVTALEHGLPPTSGWGMGIDRIVALLTEQPNLRDVVMFPLMRPRDEHDG